MRAQGPRKLASGAPANLNWTLPDSFDRFPSICMNTKASLRLFWILTLIGSLIRLGHALILYAIQKQTAASAAMPSPSHFSGIDSIGSLIALFGFIGAGVMMLLLKMEGNKPPLEMDGSRLSAPQSSNSAKLI
jgi:hypothetical protein